MDIFSVPVEVIDGSVLTYLEWNDLLRFRRVCKWTKAITDGYLKMHPEMGEMAPELEIDEGEKSFGAFLDMGIPTNKIFLNNVSGNDFFEEAGEDATEFLEQFGAHVKSLRVDQVSMMLYGKEWDFLVALKNLESFEAKRYGGYHRDLTIAQAKEVLMVKQAHFLNDPRTRNEDGKAFFFPPAVWKQLKKLKIGNNIHKIGHIFDYSHAFLMNMNSSLEEIGVPFDHKNKPGTYPYNFFTYEPLEISFMILTATVQIQIEAPASRLNVIDFLNYHDADDAHVVEIQHAASNRFLEFCSKCTKNGVKLVSVASSWFFAITIFRRFYSPDLGTTILSLVNIDPAVLSVSLPNLEKIEIRKTSRSSPGVNWRHARPEWPSLKVLDITVDSKNCHYSELSTEGGQLPRNIHNVTTTKQLYSFLFEGVSRTLMTELNLRFTMGGLPVPTTEDIVSSCPNLKKLSLEHWPGTNKALTRLWAGLPNLEEVSLKYCKGLGNVAFIGDDVKSPVFWNLKKLKKLTLGGLDGMPKVTDSLFSCVIRHMKLTHLILTSEAPLKSVTLVGVRSLCDGPFAESIEKFPFREWSLSNVSSEEFQQHEKMFRAFYLL